MSVNSKQQISIEQDYVRVNGMYVQRSLLVRGISRDSHESEAFDMKNAIMSLNDKVSKLEQLIQEYPHASVISFAKDSLASLYMLQHRWEESAQLYEELIMSADSGYSNGQWEHAAVDSFTGKSR